MYDPAFIGPPPNPPPPPVPPPMLTPPNPQKQLKNQKRDVRRKEGTVAKEVLTGTPPISGSSTVPTSPPPRTAPAPTPPFNGSAPSTIDKIPQMGAPTAPLPQYTPPIFNQPKYEPPKKGLEYLALGLGLLFPGAPIARIASGFAGGLGQGAEAKYQRAEKAAEQQYNVARDQAQAGYQNQQTAYNAAVTEQKRKFGNEQVTYAAAQEARARGIDPASGKPFPIPTVEQLLPRGKPPSYQDYANAYRQRAEVAGRFGAADLVKQYAAQAEDYNREAIAEANIQRAMAVAAMNAQARLQAANISASTRLQSASISASTRLQAAAISANAASGREAQRERFEAEMLPVRAAVQATAQQRVTYRQDAGRYMNEFRQQYMKDFYSSPGKDDKGHPLPPALNGQQSSIAHMTQIIGRASDPMAAAEWLSKYVANPNAQGLLLTFGQAQDAQMKALGKMPGGFKAPDIPGLSKQQREALAKLGGSAEQTVLSQLLGGSSLKDIENMIRSSASPDKDALLNALQGKHAAPPTPAPHVNMNEIMESLEAGAAAGG